MSVEISFPLEFLVYGTPVSSQAKRAESRVAWQERVKQASYGVLPQGHFAADGAVTVTLLYFPAGQMQGDIDNIVKPVLDALNKHVYFDDRQVERIWVQKFEPQRVANFNAPSETLTEALNGSRPVLYIRLGNDLAGGYGS